MLDSWHMWKAIAGTVLTLMLVLPVPASGQEAPAAAQTQAEPPPLEVIPVGRIPSRYEALNERLAKMRKELGDSAKTQIEAELPAFRSGVESSSTALDALLARDRLAASDLEEQRVEWNALGRRARRWQTELGDPASQIDERLEEVDALRELWRRTRAAARERRAPEVTLERVSSALSSLDETQRLLEAERNALLDLEERINVQARTIDAAMGRIVEAQDAVRAALFVRNGAAVWEIQRGDLEGDLPLVGEAVNVGISRSRRYIATNADALLGQLLLIAAFVVRAASRATGLRGCRRGRPDHAQRQCSGLGPSRRRRVAGGHRRHPRHSPRSSTDVRQPARSHRTRSVAPGASFHAAAGLLPPPAHAGGARCASRGLHLDVWGRSLLPVLAADAGCVDARLAASLASPLAAGRASAEPAGRRRRRGSWPAGYVSRPTSLRSRWWPRWSGTAPWLRWECS